MHSFRYNYLCSSTLLAFLFLLYFALTMQNILIFMLFSILYISSTASRFDLIVSSAFYTIRISILTLFLSSTVSAFSSYIILFSKFSIFTLLFVTATQFSLYNELFIPFCSDFYYISIVRTSRNMYSIDILTLLPLLSVVLFFYFFKFRLLHP